MHRLSALLLGLVLLTGTSCKNRNQVPESSYIVFQQTACFGTCPIYKMTINGSGKIDFEGERFTKKIGSYTKQLSAQETKDLFSKVYDFSWDSFKEDYPTQVSDLPSVVFELNYKEVSKKVVVRGEHPAELDVLQNILSDIAESDGWTNLNIQ